MKTLFIPFLFLLVFFTSCREDDTETLEKNVASYDVYIAGKENNQPCYWKNGQKINLPVSNIYTPNKIIVENNHVYIGGRIATVSFAYHTFWKDGVRVDLDQYLNVPINNIPEIFDFYVKNGDIYLLGIATNPNPATPAEKYEFCYWKNGVKTILFTDEFTYNDFCSITVYDSKVYVSGHKKINGITTFGYFINTTFYPLVSGYSNNAIASNASNVYLFGNSPVLFYRNLLTNADTQITDPAVGFISRILLDNNDVYLQSSDKYFKNSTKVLITDPQYNSIQDMKVVDQNVYMIRYDDNGGYKVFINNVESQSLLPPYSFDNGFFAIDVVQN
ncbi:hypothetical protein [Chryseobacterium tongliaoense]|uniref:hypothetical protein n=1 Tax=Chryseobacterium tongliaoense TaxID=3240933 RepID=UPI003515CFE2